MNKAALILIQVLTVLVSAVTANRIIHDIEDDIEDSFADADKETQGSLQKFYGASCDKDSQCLEYVAYCDKEARLSSVLGVGVLSVDGRCRPVIWIALADIVILGICICWLCSCLYKCCCCRDKGYTPAIIHSYKGVKMSRI